MRPRGFSTFELILGLALLMIAVSVFMSIFSSSSQSAMQSRNRTVAILMANSIMDEFEAHPYGAPAPPSWSATVDTPVQAWVEGNPQEMNFHKKLTFENGSFVGSAEGDKDEVQITISWREGVGAPQPGVVDPHDNKVLTARFPVWR